MEPAKGFKGILLDVLGLKPDGASPPVADSADAAAPSAGDLLLPQHAAAEPDDVAEKSTRAHIDEQDEMFAARLLTISQRFASDASAARDAQQSLQQAHQQAKSKEREVLAAADAAYTPAWRQTGIPSKPSQLQLDESLVSGCRLLDPAAIITRQYAHQQKEVLQPPAVFAYCDKAADPHFLQTTGNQKVREKISAARIAAVRTAKQRQHQDHAPGSTAQSQQEQQQQQEQQLPQPQQVPPALQGQQPPLQKQQQRQQSSSVSRVRLKMDPPNRQQHTVMQQRGSPSRARAKPVSSVPWSQLPAEDAASKVAAAAARYKAMAAIMTPEQRQLEEKIIKSMYQRLSYLRNPRYAEQPRAAPPGSAGLKGASTAHRHRHNQHSSNSSIKHPRQQAAGGLVTAAAAGFSYVPQQGVLFQAYESGGVYFHTVQLQNAGTVMKQLRLLPPQSCYFQISFPRFPLESSALAPGMCAEVDVCFMPDSLGDYEDAFTVDTPAGKFEVQLTGRRPHPELTLPPVLEVGSVLVGNTRTRTFEFVNKGGEGRFLLLTAQQWAATLQQRGHLQGSPPTTQPYSCVDGTAEAAAGHVADSADASLCGSPVLERNTDGDGTTFTAAIQAASAGSTGEVSSATSVSAGAFRISPAYLDLPAGAAAQIAVEFSPQQQGLQAQELVLVCDNCTAHPLRVEACGAEVQVELVGLDGRQWLPQDQQMPLWFGEVCPGASSTRQLRVFNATDLPFPFHWSVTHSQPQFDSSTASSTALSTVSPFTVTPAAGVLQAQAEVSFSVEFAPQFTAPHTGALKLCVQRSGDAGLLSISQWGMEGTAIIDLSSTAASANGLATLAKASAVRTTAASCSSPQRIISEDAAGEDNAGAGDVSIPCDPDSSAAAEEEGATGERQQASAWPGNSDWQVVADVAVEGVGCVISLTVEPAAALRVPGTLTVGQETSLPLQLRNDTAAPACFTIAEAGPAPVQNSVNGHGPSADVVVLPSQGVVPPHSVLDLAMHFTALRAGSHQQGFVLEVLHGRRQHLQADVAVQQVKVVPSYPCLDFGVLCVGTSATRTLQLQNTAQHSSSYWCIQQHGNQACVPSTVVTCQPSQGTLAPMACCTAAVTLTGSSEGTHTLLLQLSSNSDGCSSCNNSSRTRAAGAAAADKADCSSSRSSCCCCHHEYVQVLVTVSSPKVVLSRYRLPIQHAFTGVPQHHRLSMTNTSALPLTFSWAVRQLPHEQYIRLQNQLQQQQQPAGSAGHIALAASSGTVTEQQPQADRHEPHMQQQALSSSRNVAGFGTKPYSTRQSEHSAGQIALSISPSTGQLGPGQSLQLQLQLEPLAVGPVALLCCCQVAAMNRLVGFVLAADVGGLQVQYEVLRPEALLSQGQAARSKPRHSKHGSSRSSSPGGCLRSSIHSRVSSAPSCTAASSQVPQRVRYDSAAEDGAVKSSAGRSAAGISSAHASESSDKVATEVLVADFGTVALHQPAELVLQVTNLTSIPTELRAWVAQFPAQNQGTTSQTAAASCDQPAAGIDRSPASSAVPKAAAATGFCHSPVWSAASQQYQLSSKSRTSSPGSGSPSVHTRLNSPQHKGRPGSPEHLLSAASVAWKLTRTDPGTHSGCRVGSSSSIAAEALVSTVNSIPQLAQMQASSTQSDGSAGSNGSSVSASLKGPFRAFAGNAMMAARQAAAAAAAALGSGSAGCAVHVLPDACQLAGWGRSVLRLQAFNNLPGTYVDTLSVQVGDLPPQQIPIILRVEGSPLVLSNHRAQRAASEVLHTLLHHQHQQLLLPHRAQAAQRTSVTQQIDVAHNGSCVEGDGGSGSGSSGSGGCETSSGEAGGINVSTSGAAGSGAVCRVDLGVVPAGLQVQRAFYLCNTGPLPMHITWDWPVQEGSSCSDNPSSTCSWHAVSHSSEAVAGPEATASAAAARLGLCDQEGSRESGGDRGSLTDSRPTSAAVPGQPGQEASRPTSTGSISNKPDKGHAGKSSTSAGPGEKLLAAAAAVGASGGMKAAAGKAGAATNEQRASGVSAAAAGSSKTAVGRAAAEHDPSTDCDEQQHEQETAPNSGLEGPSSDPKPTSLVPAGDVDGSVGTHGTDVSGSTGGLPQGCDLFDADLPAGGPSSLLQLLQRSCTAIEATAGRNACDSCAGAPAVTDSSQHSTSWDSSSAARTLFKVVPEACVLPAGQQQQFMVSFCSWEVASGAHQVVLSGRQSFCWAGEAAGPNLGGVVLQSGSDPHLKLHLLPQAGGSSNQAQQKLGDTSGPIQCCITGGFRPHAAPPPRPLPALTLQLSARAAAPRLTLTDPDSFSFTYSRARDLSSQPGLQQTATMHNSTGCPQVFSLAVQGPFELVAATPSVAQDPDAFRGLLGCDSWLQSHKGSTPQATMMGVMQHASGQNQEPGLMLLPPGESVDVIIRFRPPPVCPIPLEQNPSATAAAGRASEAGSAVARLTRGGSSSRVPGVPRTGSMVARAAPTPAALPGTGRSSATAAGGAGQLECQGPEAVVALRRSEADAAACSSSSSSNSMDASTMPLIEQHLGLLTVNFATSQQQCVPLAARVLQPALVAPTKLNFGEVHMAAPRTLELLLTNPTQADAAYKAVIQPMEVTASEQLLRSAAVAAYSVVPASGMVPGRGIQMPRQTRLHVTFAPQRSGPASACLQLSVRGGDQVLVMLQGVGVHAERAEPRAAFDL